MKVLQDFDRPAYQNCFEVAGRLLFIESYDDRLATLIGSLFDGWLLAPAQSTNQKQDVTARFFCPAELPDIPYGLEEFEIADGGRCYTNGEYFYLALGSSLLFVGPPVQDNVEVTLWTANSSALSEAELARVTSFAVCSGLRRRGLFDLHAAGVVDPVNENGVLIVGASGSGKSTLTLQLLNSGWRYLSDDELLLSVIDNQVEARGFRRFFAISEATATACASGSLRPSIPSSQASARTKICFDPATQFPSMHREKTAPRWIFFTEITGARESHLNALSQTEAMTRLIRACPWATYDKAIAGSNLKMLSLLAHQTRAFDLKAGSDLLQSSRASDLLATHVGRN